MATINGTTGDDILGGTSGDDTITGLDGKDSIFGGDGNDTIETGPEAVLTFPRGFPTISASYADFAFGGDGNDTISGGGLDVLDGGAGDDVITMSSGGLGYVFGGDGNDTIKSSLINAVIDAGSGNDVITVFSASNSGPFGTFGHTAADSRVTTGAGSDTVNAYGRVTITDFTAGGAEADRLAFSAIGFPAAHPPVDRLIIFQDGADTIVRSVDLDPTNVSIGAFRLDLRLQNVDATTLTAANLGFDPGPIWIAGSAGADTLAGTSGNDRLAGFEGDDTISGGDGDDVIIGGAGADIVTGGAGADRFFFSVLNGYDLSDRSISGPDFTPDDVTPGDRITDFQTGVDRLELSADTEPTVSQPLTILLIDNAGDDHVVILPQSPALFPVPGIQTIAVTGYIAPSDIVAGTDATILVGIGGTDGNDTVLGTAASEYVFGFGGDDVLTAGAGADQLDGGAGSDRFAYVSAGDSTPGASDIINNFQHGIDKIDLSGLGATAISIVQVLNVTTSYFVFAATPQGLVQIGVAGGLVDGADLLTPGLGVDIIARDGTFVGTDNADRIVHNAPGNMTMIGGQGADQLVGLAGSFDTFKFISGQDSTPAASDIIFNFEAGGQGDTIDLTGIGTSSVSIVYQGGDSFLFAQTPSGLFQLGVSGARVQPPDITGVGVSVVGTPAADTITGSALNDNIAGGDGNDTLTGRAGADILTGGAGADTFVYISTSDSTVSQTDLISDFQSGTDLIKLPGISGTHIAVVWQGSSSFIFQDSALVIGVNGLVEGSDLLTGTGIDLVATAQDETLTGTGGNDRLYADGGSDVLIGGNGVDTLDGGAGSDTLVGGASGDVLTGGAGADIFKYNSAAESDPGAPDVITDFQTGLDKIDLRGTGVASVTIGQSGSFYLLFATNASGAEILRIGSNQPVMLSDILIGPAPAPAASSAVAAPDPGALPESAWAPSHFGATLHDHWA